MYGVLLSMQVPEKRVSVQKPQHMQYLWLESLSRNNVGRRTYAHHQVPGSSLEAAEREIEH